MKGDYERYLQSDYIYAAFLTDNFFPHHDRKSGRSELKKRTLPVVLSKSDWGAKQ